VERESAFGGATAPDWVAEWLAGRSRPRRARAEPPDEGPRTKDQGPRTKDQGSGLASSPALRPPSVVQRRARTAAGAAAPDRWLVLGQIVEEDEDRLRTQRTWLWRDVGVGGWGLGVGLRPPNPQPPTPNPFVPAALVLHFAHRSGQLDTTLVPGTCLDAELVFYPSGYPLRALAKERHGPPEPVRSLPGYAGVGEALAAYGSALAASPWLERFPVALR